MYSTGSPETTALKPAAPMPAPPSCNWPVATCETISEPPASRTVSTLMPAAGRWRSASRKSAAKESVGM
jgi:hypothetical protein